VSFLGTSEKTGTLDMLHPEASKAKITDKNMIM
jgi:hypothetical protein